MTNSSVHLKEPIPGDDGLIGSFYSGQSGKAKAAVHCANCNDELIPSAKFCGECGSSSTIAKLSNAFTNPNLGSNYLNNQRAQVVGTPNFAQISPQMRKAIPPQLKQEYCKVNTLLARERAFLVIHYALFICTNLFGFWCAYKAYTGMNADEMTRGVMAFIPIICINAFAFACFVSIKGTKGEMSRLKERLTYLHYQIEYTNLS
jgi:hypothetical protein